MTLDVIDSMESDYAARLAKRAQAWEIKYPAEAKVLREAVWEKTRRAGQSFPEPGTMPWLMLEASVTEQIRKDRGWPTLRAFTAINGGQDR